MAEPLIRFDNVSKDFTKPDASGTFTAVDKLSFTIDKGEIVAVLGKTGCGKSTMFNLLSGLIEPTSGKVEVTGHAPFSEFDHFRGKIGIVFQNDRLMPWRTALQNVLLGLQILHMDAAKAETVRRVFLGEYDPETLPSQLIRPASGRLTLLLDCDAAALLPKPDANGVGVLEVSH